MKAKTIFCLLYCFCVVPALAEGPRWCSKNNYSVSHPLAWERFVDPVDTLLQQNKIREAYTLVVDALDAEMMVLPPSRESVVVKEALQQYLTHILEPGNEAPAMFDSGAPNPEVIPPILQYHLDTQDTDEPPRFTLTIPCPALVAGTDPGLRNIAHALWSMHRVATHQDFAVGLKIAAQRSSKLYKSYENYTMQGLPMWPWELWINGFLVPDDFTQPAPKRQWVFFRPNVSPALVTGSEADADIDYGVTLEVGHVWYRNDAYNSWWGLSGMVALTDSEGVGYGGLLRWNDYTLGAARHSKNDETLIYVSIDLYKLVTGEESRINSTQGFLDAVLRKAEASFARTNGPGT